jgi:hypothetical protein
VILIVFDESVVFYMSRRLMDNLKNAWEIDEKREKQLKSLT